VSIRTVSRDRTLQSECWRGAQFFCKLLERFGFETKLATGAEGKSPVVFGRVMANAKVSVSVADASPKVAPPRTVVIYGHYDVMPAHHTNGWHTDPWRLCGRDGYLYGRGVTDNKGPLLCAVFAVHDLLSAGRLNVNVVFVVEGEEEVDSDGLWPALEAQNAWLKEVDLVLVSNNCWVGEERPCVTYGLRGVVHATVEVRGGTRDLHSGVHGGVVHEPMVDLCHLLSSLVSPQGQVMVPDFYERVRDVTEDELHLYSQIHMSTQELCTEVGVSARVQPDARAFLMQRWRQPTLSLHGFESSLPATDSTLIPCWARASVSMRLVPDQQCTELVQLLEAHLRARFSTLLSPNRLEFEVHHTGDWWLGDPHSPVFSAAAAAVHKVWGVQPLFVREGGTIPITSMLERRLGAPGLHIPLGQSSDSAHLPNERIRMLNLANGRKVFSEFFSLL
jgi:di- and tripeptidase